MALGHGVRLPDAHGAYMNLGTSTRHEHAPRVNVISTSMSTLPGTIVALLTAACASAAPSQSTTANTAPTRGTTAAAVLPGFDTRALPSVSLPAELDRVLRDYESAWSSRSPEALARLFAGDGFVLQPNRPPARGHDDIVRIYAGSGGPLALRALAYATDGNLGYIIGAYTDAEGNEDHGKFILLVHRAPGGPWQIAADMDNGTRHR